MKCFFTTKELLKWHNKYPRTRRELLSYLWYGMNLHQVNVFKEGPYYACRIGKKVFATYYRRIDSVTCGEWFQRISAGYFPF